MTSTSTLNQPPSAHASRSSRGRGRRLRRKLRQQFPATRIRKIIFFIFLGVVTVGAGVMMGRYQPADPASAE